MRIPLFPWMVAAAVLLGLLGVAGAAAAQEGCTQSEPCPVEIHVSEAGFEYVSQDTFTKGDWFLLGFANEDIDQANHTISIPALGVSSTLEAFTSDDVKVQFSHVGCFEVKDDPTGKVELIRVVESDAVDFEQGATDEVDPCDNGVDTTTAGTGSKDAGGPDVALLAVGLALVLVCRRRL